MRLALIWAVIFLSTETGTTGMRSHNASFTLASCGNNDWTPPSKSKDIYPASVHVSGDNDSEEHILQNREAAAAADGGETGIQKVTQFTLKYDDAGTEASGKGERTSESRR